MAGDFEAADRARTAALGLVMLGGIDVEARGEEEAWGWMLVAGGGGIWGRELRV